MDKMASGLIVGNGAAINISLGWYPDFVWVSNGTDGDLITTAFLGRLAVAFTSGGTNEIVVGDTLVGATSGARLVVEAVLVSSGTWAAGDAAGFIVFGEYVGDAVLGSENVYVDGDGGSNDATVTAAITPNIAIAAAAATASSNAAISRYAGSTTAGKGFTIGSTVAEEGKLLQWFALRGVQHAYGQ